MKNTLKEMNYEIKMISRYRSLVISKYYLIISLLLGFIFTLYKGDTSAPLYILISYMIILLFNSIIIGKNPPKEQAYIFTEVIKKYNYSFEGYIINNNSFSIMLLVLIMWQITYKNIIYVPEYIYLFPSFILCSFILIKLFLSIFYNIKIRICLYYNYF